MFTQSTDRQKHDHRGLAISASLGGAFALALLVGIGAFVVVADIQRPDLPPPLAPSTETASTAGPARPIYRYSVVPGGVHSAGDLREAMDRDAVVAAHHSQISLDSVAPVLTEQPRMVFMSYRRGDEIYWTKHRVLLPAGETVLTDGSAEIRARCGNAVSDVAMMPTSDAEPTPSEFEQVSDFQGDSADGTERAPLVPSTQVAHVPFMGDMLAAGAPGLGGMLPGVSGGSGDSAGSIGAPGDGTGSFPAGGSPFPPDAFLVNETRGKPGEHEHPGNDPVWPIGGDDPSNTPNDPGSPGDTDDPEDPDLDLFNPNLPPGYDPWDEPGDPGDPGNPWNPPGGNPPPDESTDTQAIPEPGLLLLFGSGAAAAMLRRRRARRSGYSQSNFAPVESLHGDSRCDSRETAGLLMASSLISRRAEDGR